MMQVWDQVFKAVFGIFVWMLEFQIQPHEKWLWAFGILVIEDFQWEG